MTGGAGPAVDAAAWSSPWRRRSPGDKVLLSLGLVGCAVALPLWPTSPLVLAIAVGLLLGPARVSPRALLTAGRGPLAFIVLGTMGIAVTRSQSGGWFALTVTAESALSAGGTALRAIAGTSAVLLLAATTPMTDLLTWLHRRGLPEPVADVAGLTYRLLFVLLDSLARVRAAQAARLGYADRRAALRSATTLVVAVLTRAWARSRRMEDGLAGRGFEAALRVLAPDRPTSRRFVAGTCALLAAVVVAASIVGRAG